MQPSDMALVREYAASQSEPAFAELVARHLNFVYSSALRRTGDAALAADVAQAVFIILARKAGTLGSKTVLTGWLYRTTQFAAADALKQQRRRQQREQEAFMQSALNPPDEDETWKQIAPELEAALDQLSARDRDAVLLRFFENKKLTEVGAALGVSEDGARVRVNRALEKLRQLFARRGVDSTADAITSAIAVNSIQVAPVALAKTISAVTLTQGAAASTSTLTLVKGALKIMAWTKAKTATVIGLVAILATSGTIIVLREVASGVNRTDFPMMALTEDNQQLRMGVRVAWRVSDAKVFDEQFPSNATKVVAYHLRVMGNLAVIAVAGKHPKADFVNPDASKLKLVKIQSEIRDRLETNVAANHFGIRIQSLDFTSTR